MLEILKKRCKKNTVSHIIIAIVIAIVLLAVSKLGVVSLIMGPEKIQDKTDYASLEGKYVTFDVKYVLDSFARKTGLMEKLKI